MAFIFYSLIVCILATTHVRATPNRLLQHDFPISAAPPALYRREGSDPWPTICGYESGNLAWSWTGASGFGCALDTSKGYFGFCPMSVSYFHQCGIAEACVDAHTCLDGCGRTDVTSVYTCGGTTDYCVTHILTLGPTESYTGLLCEPNSYRSPTYSAAEEVITSVHPDTSSASSSPASTGESPVSTSHAAASPGSSSKSADPTSTPSRSSAPQSQPQSSNAGAISGGVVGGLAVLAFAGVAVFFIRRKTHRGDAARQGALLGDLPEYTGPRSTGKPEAKDNFPAPPASSPAPTMQPVELTAQSYSPMELPTGNPRK